MAIKRTSSNSISNAVKLSTGFSSAAIPNSPTIGTATATSDVAATVTYTAAVLGATGSTFTATSNPGSVTGTGSSPITVTGLTASTSYTFSVTAGNANGTSAASSASNSITTDTPLNSYESIASYLITSNTASVTFSSIPGTYKHLQIRGTYYSTANLGSDVLMRFNSDSGSNYSQHGYVAAGSSGLGTSYGTGSETYVVVGNQATGNQAAMGICDILDYAHTNKRKTTRAICGIAGNTSDKAIYYMGGNWRNNNAITSIEIAPYSASFTAGTVISLYGIEG